jgi:5-methyltetrahydrofolate--homocysteine methyltransferase
MDLIKRLSSGTPIITDGAMGTLLQSRLPSFRGSFELLNIEHPDVVMDVHRLYVDAGAEFILTNSFGGNLIKLSSYNISHRCHELNKASAEIARQASQGKAIVAGDISATGKLLEPMGEATITEIYDAYREQIKGLLDGGVDCLVIETMSDLHETLIALRAARDLTALPVICSLTFEETGATISGTDIITGLATCAAHGATVVGANCSLGPSQLYDLFSKRIDQLKRIGVPLSSWSNAGLPKLVDGKTIFPLGPDEFADNAARFSDLGFSIIGGCCGTTPDHIRSLAANLCGKKVSQPDGGKRYPFATSRYSHLDLSSPDHLIRIGERLNPSARKAFAEELKTGKRSFLHEESRAQENEGADIIDLNVGVPEIDEVAAIRDCIKILTTTTKAPLMIDSDNSAVIEEALCNYPGIAVVNSINGKKKSIDAMIPIIKRFGCFIVALCLDDSGIHREAEKRISIGNKLIELLEKEGIHRDRIIIDPLMLAESAEPGAASETLHVIRHFANIGIKTSIGLSNISFGLPQRKYINNAFLKMARTEGLTAAIINTKTAQSTGDFSAEELLARDFITGKDHGASLYIEHFSGLKEIQTAAAKISDDPIARIKSMVIFGNIDGIAGEVKKALEQRSPEQIMNEALIEALTEVGERYSKGEYFLPQMIASANAMKNGFEVLKPHLSKEANKTLGKVVICTVYGDIHDIGKNIVGMMLENHGFEIHDLGKDVPNELVIDEIHRIDADLVVLSSLLTTTMGEMKTISGIIRDKKLRTKVMVGGAVVTNDYALSIGAHYSKDAVGAAMLAKDLMKSQ